MRARPGEVLGKHRVALVRHGRRALLALGRSTPPPPAPPCAAGGGSSVARRSTDDGDNAQRGEEYMACRSRGITCVDTGSGVEAQSLRPRAPPRRGSMLAKEPTAPEMAQVAVFARAATSRARRGELRHRPGPASRRTSWARRGCRGCARWSACACARKRGVFNAASSASSIGDAGCRSPARAAPPRQVSSTSERGHALVA